MCDCPSCGEYVSSESSMIYHESYNEEVCKYCYNQLEDERAEADYFQSLENTSILTDGEEGGDCWLDGNGNEVYV